LGLKRDELAWLEGEEKKQLEHVKEQINQLMPQGPSCPQWRVEKAAEGPFWVCALHLPADADSLKMEMGRLSKKINQEKVLVHITRVSESEREDVLYLRCEKLEDLQARVVAIQAEQASTRECGSGVAAVALLPTSPMTIFEHSTRPRLPALVQPSLDPLEEARS
jgi:hypothetical protein